MGWLFSSRWETRKGLIDHLRMQLAMSDLEVLASSAIGNNHWYLAKHSSGVTFIGLDLMKGGTKESPGWGYKSMDESCGPNEVNCPISYLAKADPATPGSYADSWRKSVEAYHQAKRVKTKLTEGMQVCYSGLNYELKANLGRKGWRVCELGSGIHYRMSARQASEAEII